MENTQTVSSPRFDGNASFETVWAILQENAIQMKEFRESLMESEREFRESERKFRESERESQREFRESQKESERKFRESQKETERIMKEKSTELNIKIGSLTNLFGDLTLGMVIPKLREKFRDLGYDFQESCPNYDINDKINNISFEVDILMQNGDKAMLVEVKTKLTIERIKKHVERLEKMRKYADFRGDKRTFLGAVAGFAIAEDVKEAAFAQGFYLIEPDGENFNITPPDGKPKEW